MPRYLSLFHYAKLYDIEPSYTRSGRLRQRGFIMQNKPWVSLDEIALHLGVSKDTLGAISIVVIGGFRNGRKENMGGAYG